MNTAQFVAIYCRVSTDDQAERKTIQSQVEFAEKYCDLHNINIYKIYKDDGISGTVPFEERQEGIELINDAREGKFQTLFIYKLDRLGRSARVTLNSIDMLEKMGLQIKSMTEPFDTSSPSGRFMITMLAGVADLERSTILERMQIGANRAATDGKWLGGIVPYGYLVNDEGYLEVDESPMGDYDMSQADVIRSIFNLIGNDGCSTISVAKHLNSIHVPTHYISDNRKISKGKRKVHTDGIWRPTRIGHLIHNTTYKGVHQYGKRSNKERELITREVPSIVTEDLWERSQEQLKKNINFAKRNTKIRDYLLTGLVRCDICGERYYGKTTKNHYGTIYSKYECYRKVGSQYAAEKEKCTSIGIDVDYIDNFVFNECVQLLTNPKILKKKVNKRLDNNVTEITDQAELLKKIKISLANMESEKESILDLYRKKVINFSDVQIQLDKMNEEKTYLENRLKETQQELNKATLSKSYYDIDNIFDNLRAKITPTIDFNTKKEIVQALVKNVVIHTNFEGNKRIPEAEIVFFFDAKS